MGGKIHCFEQRGLGKAPFRYVGMVAQEMRYGERVVVVNGIECTTKPGGTCDYCGTYIVNMFRIESADGKQFKVGCECVKKTGDSGLIKVVSEDKKKLETARRRARKLAKEDADKQFYFQHRKSSCPKAAAQPHPNKHLAQRGKTMLDYIDFLAATRKWDQAVFHLRKFL